MNKDITVCPWCFGSFTTSADHNFSNCKVANQLVLEAERHFLFTGEWPASVANNKEITNATDK